jgi:hypothetical protein
VQTLDLYLIAERCATHIGEEPSADWKRRIQTAITTLATFVERGFPLVGDNDDGRAIKLTGFHEHASEVLARSTWCGYTNEAVSTKNVHFPNGGFAVISHGSTHCWLRNGALGQHGKGGHDHNDSNSICVEIGGIPVLTDNGSSCYTSNPEQRNAERSIAHHSTVVPPFEPRRIPTLLDAKGRQHLDSLFWLLGDSTDTHTITLESTTIMSGMYRGSYKHRRTIEVNEHDVLVTDTTDASQGLIHWCFAPGWKLDIIRHIKGGGVVVTLMHAESTCTVRSSANWHGHTTTACSEHFGWPQERVVLQFQASAFVTTTLALGRTFAV